MLKIWDPLAQRAMIYWPKCLSISLREKYPKKIKSKTDKCIGISFKNYPDGFLTNQIRHKILVENASWKSAFRNPGTIQFDWIKNISYEIKIYNKLFQDHSWFLDFQKADFQHAFSTRILWRIWLVKKPSAKFLMLIPMHLLVLEFLIFLGYFSLSEIDRHFGQYIIARWAKGAQIFSIGLTF